MKGARLTPGPRTKCRAPRTSGT